MSHNQILSSLLFSENIITEKQHIFSTIEYTLLTFALIFTIITIIVIFVYQPDNTNIENVVSSNEIINFNNFANLNEQTVSDILYYDDLKYQNFYVNGLTYINDFSLRLITINPSSQSGIIMLEKGWISGTYFYIYRNIDNEDIVTTIYSQSDPDNDNKSYYLMYRDGKITSFSYGVRDRYFYKFLMIDNIVFPFEYLPPVE